MNAGDERPNTTTTNRTLIMILDIDSLPLVSLPTELSDEAAAQLLEFLHELARVLENHYADQLHRYYHPADQRQTELWPDQHDPPF